MAKSNSRWNTGMPTKEEPREGLWLYAQLAEGVARMYATLSLLSSPTKADMVTQLVKGSEAQGYPPLHREFWASLS